MNIESSIKNLGLDRAITFPRKSLLTRPPGWGSLMRNLKAEPNDRKRAGTWSDQNLGRGGGDGSRHCGHAGARRPWTLRHAPGGPCGVDRQEGRDAGDRKSVV